MSDHLSKQFDLELENIRTRILQMGGLVERQVLAAVDAEPVPGDAWTDFLPESAVLEADWKDLKCGIITPRARPLRAVEVELLT